MPKKKKNGMSSDKYMNPSKAKKLKDKARKRSF